MFGMGPNASQKRTVNFDGTNDYLTRGADLSGNANSKVGTISLYVRFANLSGDKALYNSTSDFFDIRYNNAGGVFKILGKNAAGTTILSLFGTTSLVTDQWYHLMASWDLANGDTHMYLNGVEDNDEGSETATNDTIDYTRTEHAIGANDAGGAKLNGCMAQVYINMAEYVDLSVSGNRDKFYNDVNAFDHVDMGSDGSAPTGSAPIIFLNNPLATWHTNLGSGGGFTENGALTECI